jgi:hypothetical protein
MAEIVESTNNSITQIRTLLGSVYDKIINTDNRATKSPKRNRHRLALMIDYWNQSLRSNANNIIAATEFEIAATVFKQWHETTVWNEILASIINPAFYPHSLVCLAAAG